MLHLFYFIFGNLAWIDSARTEQWNYKFLKNNEKKKSGTVATNYIPQKMGLHSFGNSILFAFVKQLVWIVIILWDFLFFLILMGNSN